MRTKTNPLGTNDDHQDVVDLDAVERLITTCGDGGRERVAALLGVFFADASRLLASLRPALARGDIDELGRAAYTLKSHGITFGLPFVAHVALELEIRGDRGDLGGATDLISELDREYRRARRALEALRHDLIDP